MRNSSEDSKVQSSEDVAIYCRVSTDEQAREGVSLDEQRERLHAYCRAMGWNVTIIEFVDDGYSAKNMERPALVRLLELVKQKRIVKIMVTKLDRLSRRLLDLLKLIDLFQTHHVSFLSTSEAFDTETPSGRLTLQVLGAVAEFERERIRERVFENMLYAAKSGKWLTQSPFGYSLEEKVLKIKEEEASIVRRVFTMFANEGRGFLAIAKTLNREGIPSRQKKEWSLRSIKLMLNNPVYKGTFMWNRIDSSRPTRRLKEEKDHIVIENCMPGIIDEELWNRVQSLQKKPSVSSRAQTSPHLLGGFLRCGLCGSTMSISWSGWPKRNRVYRCSANKNKGTCRSKPFRAENLEKNFMTAMKQLSEWVNYQYSYQISLLVMNHTKAKQEQVAKLAGQRYRRKVEAYTAGLIELEDLQMEKRRMNKEMARLAEPIEIMNDDLIEKLKKELEENVRHSADALSMLPIPDAKAMLRSLLDKVVVLEDGGLEINLIIEENARKPA